jgi:hypothetical protein
MTVQGKLVLAVTVCVMIDFNKILADLNIRAAKSLLILKGRTTVTVCDDCRSIGIQK